MRLEIEVLSGDRRDHRIVFDSSRQEPETLPYVLETEALALHLFASSHVNSAKVLIENTEIGLLPTGDSSGIFTAYPKYIDSFQREALFYNFFGIAVIIVQCDTATSSDVEEIGKVEVLARKASVDQVKEMIGFILHSDGGELLWASGPTRSPAERKMGEGKPPSAMVEQLGEHVNQLQQLMPHLVSSPLTSLTSELSVCSGAEAVDIGEQGVSWISDNLSVLYPAMDQESAILEHQGEYYSAFEVQTPVLFENRDIYENRVIHGYVDTLLRFTNNLIQGYLTSTGPASLNHHNGYVGFFSAMREWMREQSKGHIYNIERLQRELQSIQLTLRARLPVSVVDRTLPHFSNRVKTTRQYRILFQQIHDWHHSSKINWGRHKMLLTITNIPKVFELYSVMLVKSWCDHVGDTDKELAAGIWSGVIGRKKVVMYYEPVYWMPGHRNTIPNGAMNGVRIYNSENRSFSSALADHAGRSRNHKFDHRSPDIVLRITSAEGAETLIILDAKYTNSKTAYERNLPECVIKYVHGISCEGQSHLVSAMIILYPDPLGKFIDYHAHPFCASGTSPQIPVLGVQGLIIARAPKGSNDPVYGLLNHLLTLI